MNARLAVEAPAKINLGLEILGRRADGYHELCTIYQEIDLADDLVLEPAANLSLVCEGEPVPTGEDNLVLRAARLLAAEAGVEPRARLRLRKRIPAQAGLGGGSSDAAAALRGLDRLWGTRMAEPRLRSLAAALGSDVPFFLVGGCALGHGRGERLHRLPVPPPLWVVVICPERGLSTKEVFAEAGVALTPARNCNIMQRFAHYYRTGQGLSELVRNDLEEAAVRLLPEVGAWRDRLARLGAAAAALSGSGSAVYGLFARRAEAVAAAGRVEPGARAFLCRLRGRGDDGAGCEGAR